VVDLEVRGVDRFTRERPGSTIAHRRLTACRLVGWLRGRGGLGRDLPKFGEDFVPFWG
jgi:hypothetical protein